MSRRVSRILRATVVAATVLALTACAGTAAPAGSSAHADLRLQLRFLANAQFAGSYLAEQDGYYKKENLSVKIVPGGPAVGIDSIVTQGAADIGISAVANVARAVAQGSDEEIIAAGYQHDPTILLSLPTDPIRTPQDLKGKRIGAIASEFADVEVYLKANGIPKSDVTLVPIQGDPAPLVAGQVDAIYTVYPTGPLQLEALGRTPVIQRLADFGFDGLDLVYVVTKRSLQDPARRAAIVRFLRAEIDGWKAALADPTAGAKLAVDVYGKGVGFDLAQETTSAKEQASLFAPDPGSPGILWMSDEAIARSLATLKKSGVPGSTALFDTSLLKEIYHD